MKPDPSTNGKEAEWTWTFHQLAGTGTHKSLVPRPEQKSKGKTDNAPLPPGFLPRLGTLQLEDFLAWNIQE